MEQPSSSSQGSGHSSRVTLELGDIVECEVDAIVSPANNDLILGGGVSGAVRRLAGDKMQEALSALAPIPLGEAVVTEASGLKCRLVIHAAVMPLGLWADAGSIRKAVANSLKRAEERHVRTLAVPAVGTGAGNFPAHKAARILFEELAAHLKKSQLEAVRVVFYEEKVLKEYQEVFSQFQGAWTGSHDCAPSGPNPGTGSHDCAASGPNPGT